MPSFNPHNEVVHQESSTKSIRKTAQMFIDGELRESQAREFEDELVKNERYTEIYNAEKHFRSLIQNNVKRSSAHPGLADAILGIFQKQD